MMFMRWFMLFFVVILCPIQFAEAHQVDTTHRGLNSVVTQLLRVERGSEEAHTAKYEFDNPRDGWIFITSTSDGIVSISIDAAKPKTVIVHNPLGKPTIEAMRHLPVGKHLVKVESRSVSSLSLTVRAIPELQFAHFRYNPKVSSFGPYDWAFLEKYILKNINCMLGSYKNVSRDRPFVKKWNKQGKRWITIYGGLPNNPESLATLNADGVDGVILDELVGNALKEDIIRHWNDVVIRLSQRGKLVYPYYGGVMPDNECARALTETIIKHGQKIAWEQYLHEKRSQSEAVEYIKKRLKDGLAVWEKEVPGSRKNVVIALGTLVMVTSSTYASFPEVDWKVFIDMQHNLIANDPAFEGLAGIQHYTSGYMNEEYMRWTSQLNRHYYIEGNTEMLSSKYGFKYALDHIKNPDFENGTQGWEISPAEEGSITTGAFKGYGRLQGRGGAGSKGDTFLWTKRSEKGPNIISQQIKNLEPGKLYSLKLIAGDFNELKQGDSNMNLVTGGSEELMKRKAVLNPHPASVRIDGIEIVPGKSFVKATPSHYGSKLNEFNRKNRYVFNYHHIVFRAKDTMAQLTISDWLSETEPGGPTGQELIYNFVEVQPYFPESSN